MDGREVDIEVASRFLPRRELQGLPERDGILGDIGLVVTWLATPILARKIDRLLFANALANGVEEVNITSLAYISRRFSVFLCSRLLCVLAANLLSEVIRQSSMDACECEIKSGSLSVFQLGTQILDQCFLRLHNALIRQ